MANPWSKKNPFLSLFLTGANAAAGKARGLWVQQARRTQRTATKKATASWADLWAPMSSAKPKRRK